MRLEDCIEVSLAGLESATANGYRESFGAALLVTNAVECLLLRGDVDTAEALVAAHLRPGFTTNGWPLHLARAELDVLGGTARVGARGRGRGSPPWAWSHDEMWHWLTEIAHRRPTCCRATRPAACARSEAVVDRVDGSADAARTGRLLALTARAHADLADLDPAADRPGIGQELLERADRWGALLPHPARVKAAAHAMTFQAELARLAQSGEEAAWRAARDLWSEHGARTEAGYASARLAAALLAAGHRKDAEVELGAAYTVAGADAPLRRQVLELARLGRLTPTNADTDGGGDAASVVEAGDLAPHGLTSRELDVLRLLGTGATNAEIGRRLYMSPKTASVHVSAIIRKLGVNGRVQAATVAERMGLVADESEPGSAC